MKKAKAPYRI